MTNEKLISVFEFYHDRLTIGSGTSKELGDKSSVVSQLEPGVVLEHLIYMCETAIGFVREGRTEKAFRWLGFIQGVLWMSNIYTLNDLKNHSRP